MASAGTRQDLIGKNLVAVKQGNGYVLEDSAVETGVFDGCYGA